MQSLAVALAFLASAHGFTCKSGGPYDGEDFGPTCTADKHVDVCLYMFESGQNGCLPKEYASYVSSEPGCNKDACWCLESDCNTKEWADNFKKTYVPPPQCYAGIAGSNQGATCSRTQIFKDNEYKGPEFGCWARGMSNTCVENNKGVGSGDGCGDAERQNQAACESYQKEPRNADESFDGTDKHCRWIPEMNMEQKNATCEQDTECKWYADRNCGSGTCLGNCETSPSASVKQQAWMEKRGSMDCDDRIKYGCFENNEWMGESESCTKHVDEMACLTSAEYDCSSGSCSGSAYCANQTSEDACTGGMAGANCSWKMQCCQFVPKPPNLAAMADACHNMGKGTLDGMCAFHDGQGPPDMETVKSGFEYGLFGLRDKFESNCAMVASFRKDFGAATVLGSDKAGLVGSACANTGPWESIAEHVGHNSTTIAEYCSNFIPDSTALAALEQHSPASVITAVEQGQFAALFPTLSSAKYIVTAKPEFGKCLFIADQEKWGAGICTCDKKECNGQTALELIVNGDIGPMRLVQFIDGSLVGLGDAVNQVVPGIIDVNGKIDIAQVHKVTEADVAKIMELEGMSKLTNKDELWGIVKDYQALVQAEVAYKTNLLNDPDYGALKIDPSTVKAANDAAGVLLYGEDGVIYTISLAGLSDTKLNAVAATTGIDRGCFKKSCPTTSTSGPTSESESTGSTAAPTAAPTAERTKVSGTVAFTLDGANQSVVETATKKSLASAFTVSEDKVLVEAQESRRLRENAMQLARTWSVAYTITAPKSDKAAMENKVAALQTNTSSLKTLMVKELTAAGADDAMTNSLAVTSFAGTAVVETYMVPADTSSSSQTTAPGSATGPSASSSPSIIVGAAGFMLPIAILCYSGWQSA